MLRPSFARDFSLKRKGRGWRVLVKVSEKLGDYTTIRQSTVNYLGRTKADTSAVTGTKCLSKSNFPLIVSEKKEVNKNRD